MGIRRRSYHRYSHVFDCRTVSAVDFDYNSRAVYVIGTEPLFFSLQYYTVSVILYSGAITHYIIISVIYAMAAIIIKKTAVISRRVF